MKEFLAGVGVILIIVFIVIIISKLMKKTERREKREERLYSNNRDLIGYYIGHQNVPSTRFVTPLRPDIYMVPNRPMVARRPHRVRRLLW
jgi:hypothetical protein